MTDERVARLQHLTLYQQQRLASETTDERAARLQHLTVNRQQRIESETTDERATRLQRDRDSRRNQRTIDSDSPLFNQPFVRAKMSKFHSQVAQVQVSKCITCLERFPGLNVKAISPNLTECVRCTRDKHIPKIYSSANNMDPGPIPLQLQVQLYMENHVHRWWLYT